jgi:hypothetical protein
VRLNIIIDILRVRLNTTYVDLGGTHFCVPSLRVVDLSDKEGLLLDVHYLCTSTTSEVHYCTCNDSVGAHVRITHPCFYV